MHSYVKESLEKGHIRPSSSPLGAGFFFVAKKDGSLRPCIDYRLLNKITVKFQYPLPLLSDLFARIKGASWFTKIDLRGAYNLVRIRRGDEWKTAFNMPEGHFEYLVMPFGLANAPSVFQSFMHDIFREYLDKFLIVYLDDILIFSDDWESHVKQVRTVLQVLRANSLFVKGSKCLFGVQKVSFLGFIFSPSTIDMDPVKVQAIHDWTQPTSLKSLQKFLGFANFYRRFICNFSSIAKPLTDLTKKGADLVNWSSAAVEAFQKLKRRFSSAPVLCQPDVSLPFQVEVDASEIGAGAVLSQRGSDCSVMKPCPFFFRKFSPAERNYDVGNRELLAMKWAFEEWRHWLEGAKHRVVVLTDHKNLTYLESAKRLNPRQARWSLFFTRFDFVISYLLGSKNVKADALSRSFVPDSPGLSEPAGILKEGVIVSAISRDLRRVLQKFQANKPDRCPAEKLFVPNRWTNKVISEVHCSVLAGHPGIFGTRELVARSFWWPSLSRDVRSFVQSCGICARAKRCCSRASGLLLPLPVPKRPWTHISMDFISDLPVSQKMSLIWVVCDRFSKMVHLVPLSKLPSSSDLVPLFFQHVVRLHGIPENIVSDRGSQFVSRFWRAFCGRMGIDLSFSSAFHPQTNGQTERTNQTLETYLRCFVSADQDDWASFLPLAEFALNNRASSATLVSPFFCNSGFHPRFSSGQVESSDCPGVDTVVDRLQQIWTHVVDNLTLSQEQAQRFANRRRRVGPRLRVGDLVWLSSRHIPMKVSSPKFKPRFIGPYRISEVINPVSFRLTLPDSFFIHNVFHRSLLRRYVAPMVPSLDPPAPVLVEGELEYIVEKILDSRVSRRKLQYLVKWKGYAQEDNSWVFASDVHAPDLVRAFHVAHPGRPGGSDHKNLAYIQSAQRLNPRQARWSLFFGRFEFELHFRPGNKNVKADALLRSFQPQDIEDSLAHIIDPAKIVTLAALRVISTPPGKTLVANQDKERVLRWGHSSKIAGHVGVKKTLSLISRHYWWPSLRQDVTKFIASCPSCAKNKVPRQLPSGLLHPLPVSSVPWSHIAMDFITDLPCSSNCSVILVVVYRFSKMSHFIALPGLPSAPELAKIFLHQVFHLHGFPHHIVSDRGVQFTSRFWRALCSLLKVNLDFSSAYHPQSNGQVERVNQVLTTYLRHFSNAHQDDWVSLLPWAEFSYNNLPSESSSKTPFVVVYGQHPNIPLPVSLSSGVPAADFLSREFSTIWNETKVALERASLNMKKFADKKRLDAPLYSPGDKVWLSSRYIKLKIPSCKLGPLLLWPYGVPAYPVPQVVDLSHAHLALSQLDGQTSLVNSPEHLLKMLQVFVPVGTEDGNIIQVCHRVLLQSLKQVVDHPLESGRGILHAEGHNCGLVQSKWCDKGGLLRLSAQGNLTVSSTQIHYDRQLPRNSHCNLTYENSYLISVKSHYNPRSENSHYNPRSGNSHYNPRSDNSNYNPRSGNSHYNPRSENSHYNPRSENSHYNPRSENSNYNPRSENSHYNPRSENSPRTVVIIQGLGTVITIQGPRTIITTQAREQSLQSKVWEQSLQSKVQEQSLQSKLENSRYNPRSGNSHYNPRSGNSHYNPRSGNSHYNPRSGNSHYNPRYENSYYISRSENNH
ncbi:unnamed protein product [Ranitomeya imitator]|uniref:Gypsy retrotransposon integrase-like protein 1 n=1 Tax=Ranitomeya imitator TaxID=111125 RepID=A0ABN9MF74_9NEOB|nr:unnamed protein product [Ranitomeya imitator]